MKSKINYLVNEYFVNSSKWFNNKHLSFKISSLFIIIFAIILLINSAVMISITRKQVMSFTNEIAYKNNSQLTEYLSSSFTSLVEDMFLLNREVIKYYTSKDDSGHSYISPESSIELYKLTNDINIKNNNFRYLHSIFILNKGTTGFVYRAHDRNLPRAKVTNTEIIYRSRNNLTTHWTGVISDSAYFTTHHENIVSFITPFFPSGNKENVTVLNLSVTGLSKFLKDQNAGADNNIIIDCGNSTYITSSDNVNKLLADHNFTKVMRKSYQSDQSQVYKSYLISSSYMAPTSWYVITVNDLKKSTASLRYLINIMIFTIILMFILLTFVTFIVLKMITKPLKKLSEIMSSVVNSDDLNVRFNAKYSDEVGVLANSFNTMMDRINNLTNETIKNQEEKRFTEIKLMHLQIKPHFLYNSLETARFLVDMKDLKASEMISAIAHFYKLSLSGVGEFVTIKEELDHLENYLRIQNIRYSSIFDYEVLVNDSIYNYQIIKFTLQPIVENAIYHGLKPNLNKGILRITSSFEDNDIILSIYDNGVGMNQKQLEQLNKDMNSSELNRIERVGAANVNKRLVLTYGEKYGLKYYSIQNEYTLCQVRIPAKKRR